MKSLICIVCVALFAAPAAAELTARIDPLSGAVEIYSDIALSIEGYELIAPSIGDWNSSNSRWNSLVDQGLVTGWVELPGPDLLSEGLFFGSALSLVADSTISLGTPYVGGVSVSANDFGFRYKPVGSANLVPGDVTLVPEPSCAALLLLSGAAIARRRRM